MATPSNSLVACSRRSKALGRLVAGGILFVIGIGGTGVLVDTYTGVGTQSASVAMRGAA